MKHLFSLLCLSYFICILPTYAQIGEGGLPYSTTPYFKQVVAPQFSTLENAISIAAPSPEQIATLRQKRDNTFGVGVPLNFNPSNSGQWFNLPSGDRVWILSLTSTDAKGIYLLYERFKIPQGAKLFLYTPDYSSVKGAFTETTNPSGGAFSTETLAGDHIILEYYEPMAVRGQLDLHITYLGYAFKDIVMGVDRFSKNFNSAGSCTINVNCPLGNDFQIQKRAVARMIMFFSNGSGAYCTGSLINNQSSSAYFLSAWHCQDNLPALPNYAQWQFFFNYESATCANPTSEPTPANSGTRILIGCTEKTKNSATDVLLLELSQNPNTISGINPYYLGWNRSIAKPTPPLTGVHHPAGDIKKISTYEGTSDGIFSEGGFSLGSQMLAADSFWEFAWTQGTAEGGSSGSSLLDNNKRIVGYLTYGPNVASVCALSQSNRFSGYGKLSASWSVLQPFLAPNNSDMMTMDGFDPALAGADVGVSQITTTTSPCAFTNATSVRFTVRNFGNNTQNNITVNYSVTNSAGTTNGSFVVASLASGGSSITTVNLDLSLPGNHVVQAQTTLVGDQNPANNSAQATLVNAAPSLGSRNLLINNTNFFRLDLSWTPGNAQERLVLVKEGAPVLPTELPVDGTSYAASADFGGGASIGNAFAVYRGNGSASPVRGLSQNKTYHIAVIEFSCNPPRYFLTDVLYGSNIVTAEEERLEQAIRLGENPIHTPQAITLSFQNIYLETLGLELSDLNGRTIFQQQLTQVPQTMHISTDNLPKGMYLLRCTSKQAAIIKKIILY